MQPTVEIHDDTFDVFGYEIVDLGPAVPIPAPFQEETRVPPVWSTMWRQNQIGVQFVIAAERAQQAFSGRRRPWRDDRKDPSPMFFPLNSAGRGATASEPPAR